jgi:hypothetical protein
MTNSPPAFMTRFFQLGYVTSDLDQAIHQYTRLGISKFFIFDTAQMRPDLPHRLRVGLAWTGPVMIELIQPMNHVELYADAMPKNGFGINHHHTGYLVDTDDQFGEAVAWIEGQKMTFANKGRMEGNMELFYADARQTVGHYLEVVHLFEGGERMFAQVPKN